MFIFSEKEQLRYAVVNVYKNGVLGYPCKDRGEAEWRASLQTGLAYRLVVKPHYYLMDEYDVILGPPKATRPEGA